MNGDLSSPPVHVFIENCDLLVVVPASWDEHSVLFHHQCRGLQKCLKVRCQPSLFLLPHLKREVVDSMHKVLVQQVTVLVLLDGSVEEACPIL